MDFKDLINSMKMRTGRLIKENNTYMNEAEEMETQTSIFTTVVTILTNLFNKISDLRILRNSNKISGVIPITIFAWSSTISTAVQTVWRAEADQAQYIPKYTADTCTIVSDDAEDTNTTGTGLWTIKVSGILNDYTAASEVVALNGTTPVTLENEYLAINEMNPETSGTDYTAAGNIDVLYSDGDILARIPESDPCPFNISYQTVFTVPLGLTFKINKFVGASGSADEVVINMFVINPTNKIPIVQKTLLVVGGESNPLNGTSITVSEKHTMIVCATSTVGGNKKVSISVSGDLIVNSIIDEVPEYNL